MNLFVQLDDHVYLCLSNRSAQLEVYQLYSLGSIIHLYDTCLTAHVPTSAREANILSFTNADSNTESTTFHYVDQMIVICVLFYKGSIKVHFTGVQGCLIY